MNLTKHEQAIFNKGARKAISLILAHVRRLKNKDGNGGWILGDKLVDWIFNMDKRYQKKPGGIGRAK